EAPEARHLVALRPPGRTCLYVIGRGSGRANDTVDLKLAPTVASIGVLWVTDWPCGQQFSAVSPSATDGAIRATRREATVTDSVCGAGDSFLGLRLRRHRERRDKRSA